MTGRRWCAVVLAISCSVTGVSFAQDAESHFHRGFYLQMEESNPSAALREYEAALNANPTREIQAKIQRQLSMLRESIAAADMTRLMPADTLVFVEIANPGHHIEKLAQQMGMTAETKHEENASFWSWMTGLNYPPIFASVRHFCGH